MTGCGRRSYRCAMLGADPPSEARYVADRLVAGHKCRHWNLRIARALGTPCRSQQLCKLGRRLRTAARKRAHCGSTMARHNCSARHSAGTVVASGSPRCRRTCGPRGSSSLVARGAYVLPAAVTLEGQEARRLPADVTRHLFRLAVERNALTIIARVATADVHQDGPARLVSFSLDQFRRNFDLGQEGRRLVFRVRTPTSGPNGMNPHTETSPVLETNRVTTIAATFDGTVARVYVDGHLRGRTNLAAASCRVPTLCDADLPLATGALGGLLTVVALATVRPRSQMRIILLAVLAAVVGIALLHLTHATPAPSSFEAWRPPTVLVGAVWIGLATSGDLQAIESEIRTL